MLPRNYVREGRKNVSRIPFCEGYGDFVFIVHEDVLLFVPATSALFKKVVVNQPPPSLAVATFSAAIAEHRIWPIHDVFSCSTRFLWGQWMSHLPHLQQEPCPSHLSQR